MQMIFFLILVVLPPITIMGNTMNSTDSDLVYLFSHGLADSHKQAYRYKDLTSHQKIETFDYPDVNNGILRVNRLQSSLAQENEIERLSLAFDQTIAKKEKNGILIGVSRGASAIVNFMGLSNPERIQAIVLESPFDCVDSIAMSVCHESKLSWIPGIKKCGCSLMSFIFCKYKPDGIRPIDCVSKIRKDLPILIIISAKDGLVPVWSSINLYQELRNTGHTNVYLVIFDDGKHAKLINHPKNGIVYRQVTHAFYQKFNLPHDPQLASLGANLLQQPEHETLLKYYPSYCHPKYNQKKALNER